MLATMKKIARPTRMSASLRFSSAKRKSARPRAKPTVGTWLSSTWMCAEFDSNSIIGSSTRDGGARYGGSLQPAHRADIRQQPSGGDGTQPAYQRQRRQRLGIAGEGIGGRRRREQDVAL